MSRMIFNRLLCAPSSDAEIANAALEVLAWTCVLPGGPLTVRVEQGWLTLSGKTEWEYQKQAAVDGIQSLPGMVGLSNMITLQPSVTASAQAYAAASAPPHDGNSHECDLPL